MAILRGQRAIGRAMGEAMRSAARSDSSRSHRRSFIVFALGSLATFSVAARATHHLGGPLWLAGTFLAIGILLALYYLYRQLSRWRREKNYR
ncbi:hypothetical protein [Arthrobacter sulfonylureivorans]|uniref:DUF202 domain-containing protein n=1 Tax=Arthrobacter sulfonylureivorans TaxID=2486855 RepID=A0ABY3WAG3_9MICC|nr:hypothetical protein [Arthrobacter sulfonylureivorans]UNK47324.1 hypothetical protein MNQ99_08305 [Arthrobacter sulfonylureivorans]